MFPGKTQGAPYPLLPEGAQGPLKNSVLYGVQHFVLWNLRLLQSFSVIQDPKMKRLDSRFRAQGSGALNHTKIPLLT